MMGDIAEARGDFDVASQWKTFAMEDAARVFENATIAEYVKGTPLVEQAPAPEVPVVDPSTEFVRQGTRQGPDAAVKAQAVRNQKLLEAQLKQLGG